MIVAVCGDKGAPGVSTLATVLGLVWPGPRVVLEADTAGSDLSFRLRPASTDGVLGGRLAPDPSIAALAAAARLGLGQTGPLPYAQHTTLGVPVVPGVLSADRFRALRTLWPQVATGLAGWPGTVITDLGRLQHDNPVMPLARAATVALLLTPATLEGLYHVRDRAAELSALLGDPARDRPTLGVVVTGPVRDRRSSIEQVRQVLASIGSPAPVVGFIARDPAGAKGLWAGELTRRFAGSDLVRSTRDTAEAVLATWPDLIPVAGSDAAEAPVPADGGEPVAGDTGTEGTSTAAGAGAGVVMEGART